MISVEQLHKAGLGPGRPLAAQQRKVVDDKVQFFEIQQQILEPERGTLAHGDGLGRLKMGKAEGRQVTILCGKIRQRRDRTDQTVPDQAQSPVHDDQVGVVADIAGRCAQMDDAARARALEPVGDDVRHDIVTHLLLLTSGFLVIDVFRVRPHFFDLRVCDWQSELLLRFRQSDPEPPPGPEFVVGRKEPLHCIAGVTTAQRTFIPVSHGVPPDL